MGERPPRTRVRKLELILPSVRRQAALGSMTVVRWRLQSMSRAEPSHKELPRRKPAQNLDVRVFSVSRGHSLSLFFSRYLSSIVLSLARSSPPPPARSVNSRTQCVSLRISIEKALFFSAAVGEQSFCRPGKYVWRGNL